MPVSLDFAGRFAADFALGAQLVACRAGNYAPFNTMTAAYQDNVVSWPSVEPADDYTATSLLAFALAGHASR
jgi:hypothetical protein